jgi:hypothetical protein
VGKLILQELERKALAEKTNIFNLEASLGSKQFWESLGFVIQREDFVPIQNDQKLHYYKMVKTLSDG